MAFKHAVKKNEMFENGAVPRQHAVQKILRLPLLLQVVRRPLCDQGLQVVSVLLHPREEVVQDVTLVPVPGEIKK